MRKSGMDKRIYEKVKQSIKNREIQAYYQHNFDAAVKRQGVSDNTARDIVADNKLYKDIKKAIKNHELQAYYQPQYNAVTNKIVSAEALVRWVKPDGSMVPPSEFIPVLEETGFVGDVDWYMAELACQTLGEQLGMGHHAPAIAVNFSRWHVHETNFADRLSAIADKYNVPHSLFEVEITESALIDENKKIKEWIDSVRASGFSVAIDDFGSGLSSLSFVKDMSVDVLKIDKSLLSNNCEDEKERIVLESIFYFAERLHLMTVAEGVETKEQLGFLRTCSCKKVQGFLFAKPLSRDEYLTACRQCSDDGNGEDILKVQAHISAMRMLLDAVFVRYPLVIYSNLTRNSYYTITGKNYTSTQCASAGNFDDLISQGVASMHPDDRQIFHDTFCRENLLKAYERGERCVKLVTRQKGDDGVYRLAESTDYFVKSPSSDDILVISLCANV